MSGDITLNITTCAWCWGSQALAYAKMHVTAEYVVEGHAVRKG